MKKNRPDPSSGILIKSWDAHYKKVVVLRFSDDDSFLFSGGEDALIHVNAHSLLYSSMNLMK